MALKYSLTPDASTAIAYEASAATGGPIFLAWAGGSRRTELQKQIVYGSKVMPAFGDDLDPGDLKDLITYLKSCRQKPAKTPQKAPQQTPQVDNSN